MSTRGSLRRAARAAGVAPPSAKIAGMRTYEVSRTLVKSPPELWAELKGDRLTDAIGGGAVRPTEDERALAWEAEGARGTALLQPAGWGTKVTLTAEVEDVPVDDRVTEAGDRASRLGFWARLRRARSPAPTPPRPSHADIAERLQSLLDELGAAHKRPFARE